MHRMVAEEEKDFNTETLSLYRITGVAGLLLQKGHNTLANHMPFSDQRTEQLGDLVRKMMEGYSAVNRSLKQILLNYDSGTLLIVNHGDTQLALLLTARVDLDVVSNAAAVFMSEHSARLMVTPAVKKHAAARTDPRAPREMVVTGSKAASNGAKLRAEAPKPEISRWPDIRRELESCLGKVMGRAQVNKLIERVCLEKKINDPFSLPLPKARDLALGVLEMIPNRSKRAALSTELKQSFEELNLNP